MTQYARTTEVPPEKSRMEIEQALSRYGADAFSFVRDDLAGYSRIEFRVKGREVRLQVPMPDPKSKEFTLNSQGRPRDPAQQKSAYDQAIRQRWRALLLYVKATLEAVEAHVIGFDAAFLHGFVTCNNETVFELMQPQLPKLIERTGQPLLEVINE